MKNFRLATLIVASIAFMLVSNVEINAMEMIDSSSVKMMAEKKAMAVKMMAEKKAMAAKKMTDKMADKKMTDNKMAAKKMTDKMADKKMTDKKVMSVGSVDLSTASPVSGASDAKITIIEFGDYQCPKCDQWFLNVKPDIDSVYISKNVANLYYVDFPFLGSDSELASAATYCADEQGKYWEYHSVLYKNQGGIQSGWANSDALKKFASGMGLDTEKFNKCLDSGKYSDRVKQNKQVGTSNGVAGTPTFLLVGQNGKTEKIVGPQPSAAFASTIEKLLK